MCVFTAHWRGIGCMHIYSMCTYRHVYIYTYTYIYIHIDTRRDWETLRDKKRKSREPCNATNRRTVGGVNVNRL